MGDANMEMNIYKVICINFNCQHTNSREYKGGKSNNVLGTVCVYNRKERARKLHKNA